MTDAEYQEIADEAWGLITRARGHKHVINVDQWRNLHIRRERQLRLFPECTLMVTFKRELRLRRRFRNLSSWKSRTILTRESFKAHVIYWLRESDAEIDAAVYRSLMSDKQDLWPHL